MNLGKEKKTGVAVPEKSPVPAKEPVTVPTEAPKTPEKVGV